MLLPVLAANPLRLTLNGLDFAILIVYFSLVIAIGFLARRAIATSEDFLLAGRSLPAWITGLAFISANLGAIEILGMAANGAQYGWSTVHFYWIGAVPAMTLLGRPKPVSELGGLVWGVPDPNAPDPSKTPKPVWWRSPRLLGWGALAIVILLSLIFL
jgi:SSS family solute:Na+ symporter